MAAISRITRFFNHLFPTAVEPLAAPNKTSQVAQQALEHNSLAQFYGSELLPLAFSFLSPLSEDALNAAGDERIVKAHQHILNQYVNDIKQERVALESMLSPAEKERYAKELEEIDTIIGKEISRPVPEGCSPADHIIFMKSEIRIGILPHLNILFSQISPNTRKEITEHLDNRFSILRFAVEQALMSNQPPATRADVDALIARGDLRGATIAALRITAPKQCQEALLEVQAIIINGIENKQYEEHELYALSELVMMMTRHPSDASFYLLAAIIETPVLFNLLSQEVFAFIHQVAPSSASTDFPSQNYFLNRIRQRYPDITVG